MKKILIFASFAMLALTACGGQASPTTSADPTTGTTTSSIEPEVIMTKEEFEAFINRIPVEGCSIEFQMEVYANEMLFMSAEATFKCNVTNLSLMAVSTETVDGKTGKSGEYLVDLYTYNRLDNGNYEKSAQPITETAAKELVDGQLEGMMLTIFPVLDFTKFVVDNTNKTLSFTGKLEVDSGVFAESTLVYTVSQKEIVGFNIIQIAEQDGMEVTQKVEGAFKVCSPDIVVPVK